MPTGIRDEGRRYFISVAGPWRQMTGDDGEAELAALQLAPSRPHPSTVAAAAIGGHHQPVT
jgi:hypothetical protein